MKEIQKKVLITLGIGIVLIVVFFLITEAITKYTGLSISEDPLNDFRDCLNTKEITLFINAYDPTATLRNSRLIDYLSSFNIMNCLYDMDYCMQAGVEEYPSMNIEGQLYSGEVSVEELAQHTGCKLLKK
jgi:hypothetical protein